MAAIGRNQDFIVWNSSPLRLLSWETEMKGDWMERRDFLRRVVRLTVLAGLVGLGVRVTRGGGGLNRRQVAAGGCVGCPILRSCGRRESQGDGSSGCRWAGPSNSEGDR